MRGKRRANNMCNTSQVNNKQVFGNNQYTKQPKYEHNQNTTFSGNQFTKQANTNKQNFLLKLIFDSKKWWEQKILLICICIWSLNLIFYNDLEWKNNFLPRFHVVTML